MFRILSLALVLPACVVAEVGSGEPATVTDSFSGVDAVTLATFVDTTVTVSPDATAATISLTCDDSLIDDLVAEVVDGALVLRDDAPHALLPQTECHAEIDVPLLRAVSDTGSGRLEVTSSVDALERATSTGSGGVLLGTVSGCDITLLHTGSGPLTIEDLTACAVDVTTTGSGRTSLVGAADSATIEVTGSGGFGEADFVVEDLVLTVTGSGGAEVTALHSARVTTTGSGGALIHGNPEQRDTQATGSGEVHFE